MAQPKDLPRFANLRSQAELDAEMRARFLGRRKRIVGAAAMARTFLTLAGAAASLAVVVAVIQIVQNTH